MKPDCLKGVVMIDEIDFFDRRNNFQKKKAGDDWNALKKLKKKQKQSDKETPEKKDKPSPPSAETPES